MRKTALRVFKEVLDEPLRIGEIASNLGKSKSWISAVVSDLEDENLLEKDGKIEVADTYQASL